MFLKVHDWSFFAVRLAQLDKRRYAEREVAGSTHRPDQYLGRGLLMLSRKCCLSKDICKRLDFLVFSDRDSPKVVRWQNFNELGSRAVNVIVFLVAKYTFNKTDHCKYLREDSLMNILAAKKKLEFKPTWSQSNATRNNAWQDFFIACWTTL